MITSFYSATVTRVSHESGSPLYDVRTNEGAIYRRVPLRGFSDSFAPCSVGQSVHLSFPRGRYDLPFIVGADVTLVTESTDSATRSADYEPDSRDLQLRHAGNTLSLSSSGTTIDAPVAVRVQLPTSGAFRVSRDGAAANTVLEAQPFIDSLYGHLSSLELTIIAMQTQINALSAALGLSTTPTNIAATTPPASAGVAKVSAEATKSDAIEIP